MDEMVLLVQRWVNTTYKGKSGFNAAPESGRTGWSTMYALTRALQIELGISTPADSFGPATSSAYKAWGELELGKVPTNTKGQNIVKILQGAMYCKGYGPGGFTGVFGEGTKSAVIDLQTDAGLPIKDGKVYDYIFKAFLTMDAYVLTSGGDTRIRDIQRDLNNKYYKTSGVQPCDGHYQRGTNKALIYGIQTEEGIEPEVQTGSVGPTTRNLLPTLKVGSSGNFVKLLQYALYVNDFDPGAFDGYYGNGMKETVMNFQSFCMLNADGIANKQTWLSALVSTGDSTRKGKACDCVTEITPSRAQSLKSAGYETVGRYLTNAPNSTLNKKIQPGELETIFAAGLTIFPIYQTFGSYTSYFNSSQGTLDARAAYEAAQSYGFENDTTIYFAVDFDALGTDITNNILPYFKAIYQEMIKLGGSYKIGVYGPRNVCIQVSDKGYASTSFVSGMSTGFSGNLGYPLPSNWAFDQISTITVGSGSGLIEIDNNIKSGIDNGVASVGIPKNINHEFFTQLGQIYLLASQYGGDANDYVTNYYRHEDYNSELWTILCGPINNDFVEYIDNNTFVDKNFKDLIDPITRRKVGIEHLMATLSANLYANYPIADDGLKDFAGWTGDLLTVYKDITELGIVGDSNVYTTAMKLIGATNDYGHFSFNDLAGDVDAVNIATMMWNDINKPIYNVFTEYYSGPVSERFTLFYKNRFDSNEQKLRKAAEDYMIGDWALNPIIATMRMQFMKSFQVPQYTDEEGKRIAKAFCDVLLKYVENEK